MEPSTSQDGKATEALAEHPRTLVLCFDGTAGQFDNDNSNVVKLFSLLKKDPEEQLCYYQAGIGTWFKPGIVSPLLHWFAVLMDLGIAWYLDEHVLDGYRFIMQNYRAGDKVCLFGFSRGAYTARALAGMLHKVGLLPRDNDAQMPFAYKLYQREDAAGLSLCEGFKRTYCREVKIEFVGVWDTVASVGVIMGRSLPFTNSNTSVKTFRHALSLDEHRARFRPNRYHYLTVANAQAMQAPAPKHLPLEFTASPSPESESPSASSSSDESSKEKSQSVLDKIKAKARRRRTLQSIKEKLADKGKASTAPVVGTDDVLEVWFSGCHEDVGGGSVANEAPHCLSNITLRWMVRQAIITNSGILFDEVALERLNIDFGPERTNKGESLDAVDAVQPIHDQLKRMPLWWILEIMPMTYVWQDKDGAWHRTFRWHLGKGRKIEDNHPHLHETVKIRMADPSLGYKPRAQWEKDTEVYVQ
ncbi:hypothetical protein EST38_g1771 [Candolleomyces aberdarensis]|uniref:T6SS Phospholipase effector Tle1-like catalytic domain-containing protein n=1 Tax=Candolleomyces aberdarensis TaxID=2316362 RepID=A0A4Q2DYH9_9AGAR|nr:hypothetical protein EST38_g1771 [Candolleomyces aberdarensis]